ARAARLTILRRGRSTANIPGGSSARWGSMRPARRATTPPTSSARGRRTGERCVWKIISREERIMNKPVVPPKPRVLVEAQPFIPYVKEEDFAPPLKPTLAPYKKRMGFLPNALKLYAHRPEIAETLWKLNSNIMRDPSSTLDQFLKRKLAVVACATNGCAYCTAHSCSMLKKPRGADFEGWGVSEEELQG